MFLGTMKTVEHTFFFIFLSFFLLLRDGLWTRWDGKLAK